MLHAKLRNRTCQGLDRQGQGPNLQGPGQGQGLDLQGQGLTSLGGAGAYIGGHIAGRT